MTGLPVDSCVPVPVLVREWDTAHCSYRRWQPLAQTVAVQVVPSSGNVLPVGTAFLTWFQVSGKRAVVGNGFVLVLGVPCGLVEGRATAVCIFAGMLAHY